MLVVRRDEHAFSLGWPSFPVIFLEDRASSNLFLVYKCLFDSEEPKDVCIGRRMVFTRQGNLQLEVYKRTGCD